MVQQYLYHLYQIIGRAASRNIEKRRLQPKCVKNIKSVRDDRNQENVDMKITPLNFFLENLTKHFQIYLAPREIGISC